MAVTERTGDYLDLTRLQAQLPLSIEAMKKPNEVRYTLDREMEIAEAILKFEVDKALASLADASLHNLSFDDYMMAVESIVKEAKSERWRHSDTLMGRTGIDDDDLPF